MRDLTDPAGGFHSAEDADSEGKEGKFYTWSVDEIREALGERRRACHQNIQYSEAGNSRIPRSIEQRAKYSHLEPLTEIAAELQIPIIEFAEELERIRLKLFETPTENSSA